MRRRCPMAQTLVRSSAEVGQVDHRPVSVTKPDVRLSGSEGHPVHPMLVTIPIGAWVCSLVFDAASRFSRDPGTFSRSAMWLIVIGVFGALVAALFGFLDMRTIPRGTTGRRTAYWHLGLNLAAVALFALDAWTRNLAWTFGAATPWWAITFSVVAFGFVGASGYLGGRLAYHYGVRVADPDHQIEGYEQ